MKYCLVLLAVLALLFISCGGGGNKNTGSFDNSQVENPDKFDCSNTSLSGVGDDPVVIIINQACQDLYSLQTSAEITGVETIESSEFATKVKVTVKLLACQHSCVSEVENTYEAFLNPAKKWQVKSSYLDFVESESSKIQRQADLGADLASGLTFSVLINKTPVVDPYTIKVPIKIDVAVELTQQQRRSWPELDVVFPDGQKITYWFNGGVLDYAGKGEQTVTFYEKPHSGSPLFTDKKHIGEILEIFCMRLAYQEVNTSGQIKTDCLPPQ